MLSRYLNPKNDFAFKKVFGEEKHKRIPIDFLNAVLRLTGERKIVDLEFLNLIQPPEITSRKESSVDLLVRDERKVQYIVEMQISKVKGFEKRAQYYAAKTYCSYFQVKGEYHNLKKVVFLAITDYELFPNKEGYKSNHIILDNETYEHDLKDFSFTFVELPKFTKKLEELKTLEEKWYFFLRHSSDSEDVVAALAKHEEIKEAYDILNKSNCTEDELRWYDKKIKDQADAIGRFEAAKDEGRKEGEEKGRKEGKEEGRKEGEEKGRKEGKEEGRKEEKLSLVRKLLCSGMSTEQVAEITDLPLVDIQLLEKAKI